MAKQLNVNLAFNADVSQAKAQIQDLQSQLSRLTMNPTAGGKLALTDDIRRASQAAAELQAHLNKAYNEKTGNLDFSKLNQSISQSGKSLSQYGDQLRKLGPAGQQAFASLASSVAQAEVPIRRSNQLVSNLATTLKNTARWQLSSSMLHGFMGSLQSAYGYAKDLDKSLTNIRIVTGQSAKQMGQFALEANKAAKELSTTTVKYTDAALIYYQQGLGDSAVKERTDVTTKMANVTGEGVEEVSSYMTAIWNNFNKAGDQSAEHFADIMTKLGAETAASTDEIAAGLSKFSAVADTIGLSFEMASSSVTAIVDQTRESPEVVGTALKTIFSRIEGLKMGETLEDGMDLNKYSEGLAKVGVHIYDANGNLRDMDGILQDIGGTWEKLEKDEQVALAQTVAGIRQYNQFMALFDNWDHVEENLEMAAEAGGTLQEQADIYAESWQGASNRVRASLESIWMALLDDKAFIGMLNTIADVIGHIDNMIDTVGGLQGVLTMLGATLTTVFGKQMAQGLTNMAYNLQMMTAAGREKVKQQKTDFINDAANALNTGENQTKADTASSDGLKRQLTAQNALIENAERMNDIERETVQILMEQARVRDEEVIAAAGEVDQAEANRDNLRDDLTSQAYAQSGKEGINVLNEDLNDISQISSKYAEVDSLLDEIGNSADISEDKVKQLIAAMKELGATDDTINDVTSVFKKDKDGKPLVDQDSRKQFTAGLKGDAEKLKTQKIDNKIKSVEQSHSFDTDEDRAKYTKGLRDYGAAIVDVDKKQQKANKANKDAEKTYDDLDKKIKSAKGAQQTWADGVMKGAQAASTLAMSIQIAQGVVSTLKNPDMSGWEKFVSITASVGMALPMIISSITALKDLGAMMSTLNAVTSAQIAVRQALGASYTAENIAIIQNIAAKSGLTAAEKAKQISEATGIPIKEAKIALEHADSLATNTGIAGKLASAAATWQQAHANMGLLATMPPLLLAALALGAALAAVGVVAYLIIKNTNRAAKEAKAAAETAQGMKEAYESSKNEVESLNSAIDELKTKREALDNLTKGTEEWNQKLQESNDAVLALIEKYPELAKYMFTDSDGVMQISDAGLAELQKRKEEEVNQARVALQSANITKNETQIEANKEDMRKQFTSDDKGTTTMSDYHFEKVLSLIQAKGTDFSKNDLMAAVGQNQDYYNQVIDSLPEIINLIGENNALQEANDVYSKELANAILKQGGASEEDMSQAGLTGAIASEYDKEYQSQKDNWDKGWWQVSKQDIIDEYVKLNPDMTLTDKNGGKGKAAKFKDADGNAIEVTVDEMIEAIASNNAMDAVADKWDAVANKLLGINESELAKGLSGNLGETVLSGGKNEDFDLSGMSREDILELSKKENVTAADLGITDQAAFDAGYTKDSAGMEAYARDFMNAIRNEAQNYGLDNGENVGKNIDFSSMSDEDVLELEKQMRKGRIDSADDVGITEEEAKQQGYESAEAFFEAWKEGLQNEKTKIDNGEDRQSDGDEWFNYEQTRDKKLYEGDEATSGLRESRISEKERDQILTEAGKTEEDFNTEKSSVEESVQNNVNMAESYKSMKDAYKEYQDAVKNGTEDELTKDTKKLAREYDKFEKQMEDVAACSIEMNDGFQDIVDNQERWRKALNKSNKGTKEYAKAMNEVRASVAKVLNVEEDAVSDDFLAEHFELAVDAANNVDGAMEQLREAFGQDYVAKMDISPPEGSDVETVRQELNGIVSGLSAEIEDLELGATLDDSQYIASLNNMLAQGTITQQQVNDILGGMGYEPQIEMVSKSVSVGGWPKAAIPVNILGFDLGTIPANFIPQVNFDVKVPKITGGNKKSNTSTATPSSGSKPSSGSPQSGGGGGGGGGNSKPKKADKKKKKDEIERYHEVKNSLEDLEKALDKVDKAKDRAWGKDKMKAIKEEIDLLDKEIGLQEQYLDEINTNYTKDKKALNKYGVEFDAGGNISNYDEVMEEQIDIFNSKRTEAAEKAYENFKEAIEQYEETHDLWLDEKAAYQDMLDEKYDKLTELATAEFEITMEIDDQTQEYLDWLIGQSEDDIFQAADRIASINLSSQSTANANNSENGGEELIRDILENDNHNLSQKTIEGFLNNEDWAINKVSKETFTAEEIEQLEEGAAAMREAASKLREDEAAIHEELSNIISETTDQMDRQIDIIDTLTDMIQTYVDIVDVVGKKVLKMSNDDIKNLERSTLEGSRAALRSSKEEYETLKTERETLYAEYKRIEATLDETSKAMWRERLQEVDDAMLEAQSNYTSRWQETLEKAAEIFENEVTRTLEEFSTTMTGAFKGSLEELQEAFDQEQEISQLYVQDYKKIYELSKLTRDISTSIDKTDNLEATRELADLQKTIAEYEEAGVQMSQYEIDHLRKKYELKLAEIALEESQNAKSQVRMQRDSEGNYGYVYTANEEDVAAAEQSYEDKLYEMQELNGEYINELQSNILQLQQDLAEELANVNRADFENTKEYTAKLEEIKARYYEKMGFYTSQMNIALDNQSDVYENDWTKYSEATGYKISANEDFVDSWDETTLAVLTGFENIEDYAKTFYDSLDTTLGDLSGAFDQWYQDVDGIMEDAGSSIETFGKDVEKTVGDSKDGLIKDINDAENAVSELKTAFEQLMQNSGEKATGWYNSWNTKMQELAKQAGLTSQAIVRLLETGKEDDDKPDKDDDDKPATTPTTKPTTTTSTKTLKKGSKVKFLSGRYYNDSYGGGPSGSWGHGEVHYITKVNKSGTKPYHISKGKTLGDRDRGWLTKSQLKALNTGGYTGSWGSNEGRLALLHQKEIVLNAEDTANFLKAVDIVRDIASKIDLNAGIAQNGIGAMAAAGIKDHNQTLEQQVSIQANFPNATNHSEIEQAFENLVNMASQYANRK